MDREMCIFLTGKLFTFNKRYYKIKSSTMEHDYIKWLKENNLTVKLLNMSNAPLIISFLYRTFKSRNRGSIMGSELKTALADYLYHLNEIEEIYPLPARQYLENWTNDGFLRKYYTADSDEPVFDLTPPTEKALDWIKDLDKKEFVGTESRLLNIFAMLKEIVFQGTQDPGKKITELEKQKESLEKEIEKIKAGFLEKPGETKIKERFLAAEETTRKLLSDFRQIEQNFRDLDGEARKKQVTGSLSKGKLLDDIFRVQDLIWDTDQGRSFKAFWEFLMSQSKQDELDKLIITILHLPEIRELQKDKDNWLEHLKINLVEAGEKVYKTNASIIEQLRKYLDNRMYLENKRITEIIAEIEKTAVLVKDSPPSQRNFLEIDDKPSLEFIMERPLYSPPRNPEIKTDNIREGSAQIDTTALYQQLFINPQELEAHIRELLSSKSQVTLKEITESFPIQKGLLELVTYLGIAARDRKTVIDDEYTEMIEVANHETRSYSKIQVPRTIFCR